MLKDSCAQTGTWWTMLEKLIVKGAFKEWGGEKAASAISLPFLHVLKKYLKKKVNVTNNHKILMFIIFICVSAVV